MIRVTSCLLLLIACHGSNPPPEPEPAGEPPVPPIEGDVEPSYLPPEPHSPGDARTISPSSGTATGAPGPVASAAQVGGMGGMGGMGGLGGIGGISGSAPATRP